MRIKWADICGVLKTEPGTWRHRLLLLLELNIKNYTDTVHNGKWLLNLCCFSVLLREGENVLHLPIWHCLGCQTPRELPGIQTWKRHSLYPWGIYHLEKGWYAYQWFSIIMLRAWVEMSSCYERMKKGLSNFPWESCLSRCSPGAQRMSTNKFTNNQYLVFCEVCCSSGVPRTFYRFSHQVVEAFANQPWLERSLYYVLYKKGRKKREWVGRERIREKIKKKRKKHNFPNSELNMQRLKKKKKRLSSPISYSKAVMSLQVILVN